MKKIIIILLILISIGDCTIAQSIDTLQCDAPDRDTTEFENLPWFGNNNYLENSPLLLASPPTEFIKDIIV